MLSVQAVYTGGPDALNVGEVDDPRAQEGEVLVRVRAAALNHRDVYITKGMYPGVKLPCILGSDACGELPNGRRVVIDPMIGWGDDPRYWNEHTANILGMPRNGTLAEYVCVPKENIYDAPESLSDIEVAAIPLAGLTAYRAVFTRGKLQAAETLLLTGIGGGVQTMALLFAKKIGAHVIVTSSSDEKLAAARGLGADETLNYKTDEHWARTAKKLAHNKIDVAIDSAGGATLAKLLDVMRTGGRVVLYGATLGDATIRPFSIFWKHLDVLGTSMGSPHDFKAMLKLFADGDIRPVIDHVYALEEAPDAFKHLDQAEQFGKIIFRI